MLCESFTRGHETVIVKTSTTLQSHRAEWPEPLTHQRVHFPNLDIAAPQPGMMGGGSVLQERQSDSNEVTQQANVPVQGHVY